MSILVKICLLCFLFISISSLAQDKGSDKTQKKNEVESAKLKRKKVKAEWKAKRKKERIERKSVRTHEKRLQTKETRKRMKKNRQKATRTNQNKKQFFLIRLFKPKPRTGAW